MGVAHESERIACELLVLRCARNEKEAFEELVHRWERQLLYYIRRLVDDEPAAWDILQETWVGVLKNVGSLREPRSLATWLYRLARNRAVDHLRSRYVDVLYGADEERLEDLEAAPEDVDCWDAFMLHQGLTRLSPAHREVLTLHFLEDFSVKETAEILGVSEGTVKSRLHYAKHALRAVLEEEERQS